MKLLNSWHSLGRIIVPERHIPWDFSHASLPVPMHLEKDIYRLFFTSRNTENKSSIGYIDLKFDDLKPNLVNSSSTKLFSYGPIGRFDGDGIYLSSIVKSADKERLYTIGWKTGNPAPMFYASIGYIETDRYGLNEKIRKRSPILDTNEDDCFFVSAPFVIRDNNTYRMWYLSCYKWEFKRGIPQSFYHIKYAESDDGIHWRRLNRVCIGAESNAEVNISRLWVLKEADQYHGWFATHGIDEEYKIHYAISEDGIDWIRQGPISILTEKNKWESKAQTYPAVIKHKQNYYMFYNGNGFGKTGIGIAVCTN